MPYRIAGHPDPLGPQSIKDWRVYKDPVPHPLNPAFQLLEDWSGGTFLSIDNNGIISANPNKADPNTVCDLNGNLLVVERAGSMVFKAVKSQ